MKRLYYLLTCLLLIYGVSLRAQCPPTGFASPAATCANAPVLCANIDGYCALINTVNTPMNFPGCPGNQLNNSDWFAFYAGSTSISLQIVPSNCQPASQQGLQCAIYAACINTPMVTHCACSTAPMTLTANNYVVGQIYWFVIDGCGGDVCNYTVHVLSGSTVPVPLANPDPISGPTTVCAGTTTGFNIPAVSAATIYQWTITPAGMGTVTGSGHSINVNWAAGASGTATLCVDIGNGCYPVSGDPGPSCMDITVIPKPTAAISGSGIVCPGGTSTANLTVTFTGNAPWDFVYKINGVAQPSINVTSSPYTLMVNQPGTYTLGSVTDATNGCIGTVSGTATVTQSNLNASATVTQATCGLSNGAINLTAQGGQPGYQFTWSSGQNTEDLSNIPAGDYTVTVTDQMGCTKTVSATVNDLQATINVSGTTTQNTTCIGGNGSITTTITPSGTYTYVWSNGETTQNLNNLPQGTYTITVTKGLNCTKTVDFTINDQPNTPNASATTVQSTCDLPNGNINLTATGGVTPYTFAWSNGATTQNINSVTAGDYTVTVTGANGCTKTVEITLNNNNPPFNITANTTANTTCIGGNGSINVNVAPANTYTYIWSNGETTKNLTNVPPGDYTITVSAGGTCTDSQTFTVNDLPNQPNPNPTVVNASCDLSNGAINLTVSGGVAPYTYMWSNNATTQNLPNSAPGDYTVTVTGANGCTKTAEATINNVNPPINITSNVLPNTVCNNNHNGSINLSVAPAAPYTYTWSTGATTTNLTNLAPGDYTVTVSKGGSCTEEATITVPDNPNPPTITSSVTDATCNLNNGIVHLTISAGVTPYSYLWSNGATTKDINNVGPATYNVTVTGANGCTNTTDIDVSNNNPPFNISANVLANTSCASGNGNIDVSVSPNAPYTYIWSNGTTTQDLHNLTPGIYTVTVSAGGTCTDESSFTIDDSPNTPTLSFNTTDPNCGLSNGSATMSVSGGVTPYTYHWSNGKTTKNITTLAAGDYTVTVTGANGCTTVDGVVLTDNIIPIDINGTPNPKTSCSTNNGTITLILSPSNMAVTWSNGATTANISNLGIGDYTVTVSAGGTCTQTATFTIDDGTTTPVLTSTVVPAACSLPNGSVDLTVTGGVGPYTYLWSNGKTTQDITNLSPNNYTVTVTTSVGCTDILTSAIQISPITITATGTITNNVSCLAPNGAIGISVAPAGYTYTYKWSNSALTQNISNLAPATYTVTVTLGSCTSSATFDVQNSAVSPNLAGIGTAATCGLNNGAADVTVSGGTKPYTYVWSTAATTQSITSVNPGNYTVTVHDNFGCSSTTTVPVANNNLVLNISPATTANTSCTTPNGAIDISVTPVGTYNYTWSTASTTEDLSSLQTGSYTVTVTFGTSCSSTATIPVPNNTADPAIAPAVTAAICSASNGAIDLTVGGPAGPYVYAWSNTATTEDLANIPPGTYTVTITAANGCTTDTTLTVANNSDSFVLSGSPSPLTHCGAPNGAADLVVTPAGTYTYSWSTGDTTEDIGNLAPGTYTVSVATTGSCIASTSFIVADARTYPAATQAVTPEICNLLNGAVDLTVTGGVLPYSYAWSGAQTSEDLAKIAAGDYTVTVTGANGCTTIASTTVPGNSVSFSISGAPVAVNSCIAGNGAVDISLSPTIPGSGLTYTYVWSTIKADTTQDLHALDPGIYTVTVSAGGTCTSTATYTILNAAFSPAVSGNVTQSFCGQSSGAIALSVSGGMTPYSYHWSSNASTQNLSSVGAGPYSVTITGANGCTDVESFTITDNVITPTISGLVTPNTSCITNNGALNLSVTPALAYTYKWAAGQTTQNLSALPAGDYTVTVYGGGACTNTASYSIVNNTPSPVLTGAITQAFCAHPTGSIDLTAGSGVGPFTYKWSNSAVTEDISGILPGTYGVTATGSNGCTSTASYVLKDSTMTPVLSAVTTPNTSCIVNNGTITLSATPALPYTFVWSNGQQVQNPGAVPAGNYTVTVSAGTTCTASATYTVANGLGVPTLNGIITKVLCFGDHTGAVDQTVVGGTQPFQFKWTPVSAGNTEDLTALAAGVYAVTLTDALGCTANASYTITQPQSALQISCDQTAVVSMPGASDGSGKVVIAGGVAPYKVVWSPGSSQSNVPAGNFAVQNLAVGSYDVTVTDANGCTAICLFNIKLLACNTRVGTMSGALLSHCGPGCITATYNSTGQFLEPGDAFQYVLHEGSGNTIVNEIARSNQPTFCFNPATMGYGTTYYISAVAGNQLPNGNVDLTHFCTVVATGTPIVFKAKPVATIQPVTPITCANPVLTVVGNSDLPGSGFAWTTTSGGQISGSATIPQIKAVKGGTYTLIVNLNGCLDTASVLVKDLINHPIATITASPTDILNCKISNIILSGIVEGTTNANTVWMVNGTVVGNGTVFPINQPGTYSFIIQDTLSFCKDTAVLKIDQNLAYPSLFIDPPGALSCKHPSTTLTGGSPFPGIQFKWKFVNGTDTTQIATGTSVPVTTPGTYLFYGIDPTNGCNNTINTVVVADFSKPVADAGKPFSIDCFGQTAHLDGTASSGAPSLDFLWTTVDGNFVNGATTSTPLISEPGTYALLVTNPVNGCTDTAGVTISPIEPTPVLTVRQPKCYGDKGVILVDSVIGGKPPILYSIDNGQHYTTQKAYYNLSKGDYTILIQDANACSSKTSTTIVEPDPLKLLLTPQVIIRIGDSTQLDAQVNVPLSDLKSIVWTPTHDLSCFDCLNPWASPFTPTYYQLFIQTKEGCKANAPALVWVHDNVDVYVPNIFSPDGDNDNNYFTVFGDPVRVKQVKSLQVFNRWGDLVFENHNFPVNTKSEGWDGRLKGERLDPAVFVWYCVVEFINGREELYKGDVTLKR
jgi:gliding motility-associated-like protein